MNDRDFFAQLAEETDKTVDSWANTFQTLLGADGKVGFSDGCVYAVGSAGRGELGKSSDLDVFVEELDSNKRFDSYKLRFARCMTCYSIIAALLWESRRGRLGVSHVSMETMIKVIDLSPVQRLQLILDTVPSEHETEVSFLVTELLGLYRKYLESRMVPDDELKPLLDVSKPKWIAVRTGRSLWRDDVPIGSAIGTEFAVDSVRSRLDHPWTRTHRPRSAA